MRVAQEGYDLTAIAEAERILEARSISSAVLADIARTSPVPSTSMRVAYARRERECRRTAEGLPIGSRAAFVRLNGKSPRGSGLAPGATLLRAGPSVRAHGRLYAVESRESNRGALQRSARSVVSGNRGNSQEGSFMSESMSFGLDLAAITSEALGVVADHLAPKPTEEIVRRFIDLAFFASLEREEGTPVTFALALVDRRMFLAEGVNSQHWRTLRFREPLVASVGSIAKLAPAADNRQTYIAIEYDDATLRIAGLIRTNTEHHRLSLGEVSSAGFACFYPLVARAVAPGIVALDLGPDHLLTLSRGATLPQGLNVFNGGRIFGIIAKLAESSGLDAGLVSRLLRKVVHNLATRGHGGTVLILPDGHDAERIEFRFHVDSASAALQDVVRFCGGENLGPTAEVRDVGRRAGSGDQDAARDRARTRAVAEHEFMRDGASFATDLASVDGALVLDSALRIVGFGGHLHFEGPTPVPVLAVLDLEAREVSPSSLENLGTRHNSTARYCFNTPGALAFVASQDGGVSCFLRAPGEPKLWMWRPVSLQTKFSARPATPPAGAPKWE